MTYSVSAEENIQLRQPSIKAYALVIIPGEEISITFYLGHIPSITLAIPARSQRPLGSQSLCLSRKVAEYFEVFGPVLNRTCL